LVGKCVTPGKACKDSFDCDEGQYCEPTLEQCLPQPGVGNGNEACEFRPPVLPFNPKEEWHWESSPIRPEYNQVINTPMVMDLDNDKVPDVVIVTSKQGEEFKSTQLAFVRALNGNNGSEKWGAGVDAYKDEYAVNPRGTPAVGDIDGDGEIEIVAPKFGGGVIAFDSRGNKKWTSTRRDGTAYTGKFAKVTQDYEASVVVFADMNNDGKAEVIVGGIVLDSTGKLVSDALIGRETWGANDETFGPVSIVADVDGNPNTTEQYVVTGGRAMHANGELWWPKKGQPRFSTVTRPSPTSTMTERRSSWLLQAKRRALRLEDTFVFKTPKRANRSRSWSYPPTVSLVAAALRRLPTSITTA